MSKKLNPLTISILEAAVKLADSCDADAVLVLTEQLLDWKLIGRKSGKREVVISSTSREVVDSAQEFGLKTVYLDMPESTVNDRLAQSVIECVAEEYINQGASVVTLYNGFDLGGIDSISVVELSEHLGRLTARDLKKLDTKVPLETMRSVVDLALEIGREGREGKPVGTMFVVGDHRKVLEHSRPAGFDFVRGYTRRERNIKDARVREGLKEIAQVDGAFIIAADGTVEASARLIDTDPVEITMTTGLGSRHFSAAAISKNTKAISAVVSESNGTVRIFQDGEVVLRLEPLRRALKWKESVPPPETD